MINLAAAQRMVAAAENKAEQLGVEVAVAVYDAAGHPVAAVRMDGLGPNEMVYAAAKALSAAPEGDMRLTLYGGGAPTRAQTMMMLERVITDAMGPPPNPGGTFQIILGGKPDGAIGVSGASAEQNDEIAQAALAAL